MVQLLSAFCALSILLLLLPISNAFLGYNNHIKTTPFYQSKSLPRDVHYKSKLFSTLTQSRQRSSAFDEKRKNILNRKGNRFYLDKVKNIIEFGLSAELVTNLTPQAPRRFIEKFVQDEDRIASSLWDSKLRKKIGKQTYRLQLRPLKFVTLQLEPSVDMVMWVEEKNVQTTVTTSKNINNDTTPVFYLQSIGFDPNLQLLPGVGFNSESLNINIETCGSMQVSRNGSGLEGKIGFVTSGKLPVPLLLLPESVLKSAADLLSNTVKVFIIQTFEKSVIKEYQNFYREEKSKSMT